MNQSALNKAKYHLETINRSMKTIEYNLQEIKNIVEHAKSEKFIPSQPMPKRAYRDSKKVK